MYKKILLPVLTLCVFLSCKKNVQDRSFHGDAKVFFASHNATDTFSHSFANNAAANEKELMLPLNIMGKTSPEDRFVNVAVEAAGTTALPEEYELGQAVIPAGSVTGYVPLKLINSSRLESRSVQLTLHLRSNENFIVENHQPDKPDELAILHVTWTNVLAQPTDWPTDIWGGYSKTKHRLVIDLTGHFLYSGTDWTAGGFAYQVLGVCNEWLEAYQADHSGEPYRDEAGNPIRFCPTCY